jgi:hypothetical protein
MKKIRYEVRGLMGDAISGMIRLASLLKLTTAITLSSTPDLDEEGLLPISLEILVRLATINRAAEEVATEIPQVNSLFELSILRPVEQLGCLSKMANGAIESIERHYKEQSSFFTRQLTAVTVVINKGRRARKISLVNLSVTNPAKAAALKLKKSKNKSDKKKQHKKLGIKRIKGLIH